MLDQNTTSTAFTPVSPAERYAKALSSGQFLPDDAQAQAVHELGRCRAWKDMAHGSILRFDSFSP